jgi:hypothetical protein
MPYRSPPPAELLLHPPLDTTHLAKLDSTALDYLRIRSSDLHCRAIGEARDLLDVVLESLEHSMSTEHQRRLIERADDELASAQRWGELAANARFCLDHPELAQQLAGNATPSTAPATAPHEELRPRRANRKNAASG